MKSPFRRSRKLNNLISGLDLISLERENQEEVIYGINQKIMANQDLMFYYREKNFLSPPFLRWDIPEKSNLVSATKVPLAIELTFKNGSKELFGPSLKVGYFKEGFYLKDSSIDPLGKHLGIYNEALFLPGSYFPNGF